MGRLIISDVDGTLLKRNEKNVPSEIIGAIKNAVKNGNKFCVASGRCLNELREIFSEVYNEIYFMCLDGAGVVYKDKALFAEYINKEIAGKITEKAKKTTNLKTNIYSKSQKNTDLSTVLKISLTGEDVIIKGKAITSVYEREFVSVCACNDKWYEIVAKGVNKGSSLKKLCSLLEIPLENVIAIGDNFNDIEMLRAAGKSYAVKYSPPMVLAASDEVVEREDIVNIINETM